MDQFEFEIRYRVYDGLNTKANLGWTTEKIFSCIQMLEGLPMEKKLMEMGVEEIKTLTFSTYTDFKKNLLEENKNIPYEKSFVSEYIEQLEYELRVVKEMGFNTYLLVVQDFINWSKNNGIAVGPGRGSAAGSLVCYLVGITDADPLVYGLLFERFLNPARVSLPDIDVDFEDTQRDQVIEYVKSKYGKENVSNIANYMKMSAKAVFKDVARVMGVPFDVANRVSGLIDPKLKLKDSIEANEELKNYKENDEIFKKIFDFSMRLEGNYRQMGVHACGILITPRPVTEFCAVQPIDLNAEKSDFVTQFDGKKVEEIGLIKMDFLGLRNMTTIKNTIKIILARLKKNNQQIPVLLSDYMRTMVFTPPLDDEKSFEILHKGDTSGIFQLEGDGITQFLVKLKPTHINDIVAMVALYRPGPLEFIPHYIDRKHGKQEITYMSEELTQILKQQYSDAEIENEKKQLEADLIPILEETYGIPVYQEQLMKIAQMMAGFSVADADLLRRGIGKKIREVIEKIKGDFIKRSGEYKNYKQETAKYIYEKMIEPAADYSFNKSHAVAYGLISYQTAYLKAHYPLEFHAALMRGIEDDNEKLSMFVSEVQSKGITVLTPDVNKSFTHVSAVGDDIRLGFFSAKGVGVEVGEFIERQRESGGIYKNFDDFLTRCRSVLNKKNLEFLTKAGTFDCREPRQKILFNLQKILDWIKNSQNNQGGGLFGDSINTSLRLDDAPELSRMESVLMEYEVFKGFVSLHPFDGLYQYIKSRYMFISTYKQLPNAGSFKSVCYIKGIQKAKKKGYFVLFEDMSDSMEVFLKDVMDLKKFDIVILEGFRGVSIKIDKIIRTSLDFLVSEAKRLGQYNENETVAEIRIKRLGPGPQVIIVDGQAVDDVNVLQNVSVENEDVGGIDPISENFHFSLPESILLINKVIRVIKENPGEYEVFLDDKVYHVNDRGLFWLRENI